MAGLPMEVAFTPGFRGTQAAAEKTPACVNILPHIPPRAPRQSLAPSLLGAESSHSCSGSLTERGMT